MNLLSIVEIAGVLFLDRWLCSHFFPWYIRKAADAGELEPDTAAVFTDPRATGCVSALCWVGGFELLALCWLATLPYPSRKGKP